MADRQYTFPALVAGTASSYCGKDHGDDERCLVMKRLLLHQASTVRFPDHHIPWPLTGRV
jgi:hypothetical protein